MPETSAMATNACLRLAGGGLGRGDQNGLFFGKERGVVSQDVPGFLEGDRPDSKGRRHDSGAGNAQSQKNGP